MSDLRLDRKQRTGLNATASSVRDHGEGRVLRCVPDPGHLRTCKPGQYTSLGLPVRGDGKGDGFLKRAYSIGHPILTDDLRRLRKREESEFYEFYIRRVPASPNGREQLTPHLRALCSADRVYVAPKIVGFHTLDRVEPTRDILFVATETGEAPHNTMIWQILTERRPIRFASLILGGPGWDSAYWPVHTALMEQYPQYRALRRPYSSQDALLPMLDLLLHDDGHATETLGFPFDPRCVHVFLCGDPQMIGAPLKKGAWAVQERERSTINLLISHGFEVETKFRDGTITFEAYW